LQEHQKKTGVIGINYDDDSGLFFDASLSYTGSAFSRVDNIKTMSSYSIVNVKGGYRTDDLTMEIYARNLTDKLYETNNNITSTDGTQGYRLGAPREIGVRATYAF
jgi:outer membrane receptor protein involved in Fe transport